MRTILTLMVLAGFGVFITAYGPGTDADNAVVRAASLVKGFKATLSVFQPDPEEAPAASRTPEESASDGEADESALVPAPPDDGSVLAGLSDPQTESAVEPEGMPPASAVGPPPRPEVVPQDRIQRARQLRADALSAIADRE